MAWQQFSNFLLKAFIACVNHLMFIRIAAPANKVLIEAPA
jgi:hypothetical protein